MALYRRAAVRRAAVGRYLLLTAKFDAVAHVGTDRRTDTLPFYKPCPFFTLLPQESKRIDKFQNRVLEPVNSIVFVILLGLNILLSSGLMGA